MISPSRTPLASNRAPLEYVARLFPEGWTDRPCWEKLAEERMRSAWSRRLSWRNSDKKLGAFLTFLEENGAATTLTQDEWNRAFLSHLTHPANQHLLFLLIRFRSESFEDFVRLALPKELVDKFLRWQRHHEADQQATRDVLEVAELEAVANPLQFRNIPLARAFTYPTIQSLILPDNHA